MSCCCCETVTLRDSDVDSPVDDAERFTTIGSAAATTGKRIPFGDDTTFDVADEEASSFLNLVVAAKTVDIVVLIAVLFSADTVAPCFVRPAPLSSIWKHRSLVAC